MNTRKTLLAALASGALLLPLALAAPAYANPSPGSCSDENAGARGSNLPKCGSDLLHVGVGVGGPARLGVNIGTGGDCNGDTLLLIQVRANEHDAHQRYLNARDAYNTALSDLQAKQAAYAAGYAAWTPPIGTLKTEAAYQATPAGASLHAAVVAAQSALNKAKGHIEETHEADGALIAKIQILTGRIGGIECHPVTTTPPPPPVTTVPPTTDVPPPAQTIIQQPPTVIVQGPAPQIIEGPSQVGQAPQGYVSAGGGADAAEVAGFSS